MPVPQTSVQQEPAANMAGLLQRPRQTLAAAATLAMGPTAPFLLKHHWAAWEVASEGLEDAFWLPKLKKHILRPGINHVHTLRVGQLAAEAYQDGVTSDSREGWTFIAQHDLDPTHRPAGVPDGPYIREVPARDPRNGTSGFAYLEAWQVPLPTMPGDEDGQRFKFDRGAYNRWRLWLVESGQIKPPQPHVIAKLVGRYEARVPAVQSKQWPTTEMASKMVAAAEKVATMHVEAEVPEAPELVAPPAPGPRKSKKVADKAAAK